jgi:hypothetical protein
MSKDGYYGDFDSLQDEQEAYTKYIQQQVEQDAAYEDYLGEQQVNPTSEGETNV